MIQPRKLKPSELGPWREARALAQGGCALCGQPFETKNPAVADHDHKTGLIRGVLHRGCNALLGHVENNAPRYFMTNPVRLARWAAKLAQYLHGHNPDRELLIYPTHRTEDEKRDLRNKRARAARAAKRAA